MRRRVSESVIDKISIARVTNQFMVIIVHLGHKISIDVTRA